ncbi:hypothetical protein GUJ93_ZPchr0002g24342 [Zizania palustris]|uniref:Secreted protein n=1 Tax=Zizania palustris TaxID=103762 RepID=A0A8J5RYX4_ZIZPA|nr:hypothetical protein GUJ93_ZPchr0002g24342 [Zizania palustris]
MHLIFPVLPIAAALAEQIHVTTFEAVVMPLFLDTSPCSSLSMELTSTAIAFSCCPTVLAGQPKLRRRASPRALGQRWNGVDEALAKITDCLSFVRFGGDLGGLGLGFTI